MRKNGVTSLITTTLVTAVMTGPEGRRTPIIPSAVHAVRELCKSVAAKAACTDRNVCSRAVPGRLVPVIVMSDGYVLQCGRVAVVVDYWTAPQAAAFFLTHMHADHYKGLHNDWCQGTIHCSDMTCMLLHRKWPLLKTKVIPVDEPITIQLPEDETLTVTAINANHCPVRKPANRSSHNALADSLLCLPDIANIYRGQSCSSLKAAVEECCILVISGDASSTYTA